MIKIPDGLFAANDDANSETDAPDFGAELAQSRRAAAQMQASATATRALHDLDRSFDDTASDPSTWPSVFETEVQRIRREDLGGPAGAADDGAFSHDFDDLAAAKFAVVRRIG